MRTSITISSSCYKDTQKVKPIQQFWGLVYETNANTYTYGITYNLANLKQIRNLNFNRCSKGQYCLLPRSIVVSFTSSGCYLILHPVWTDAGSLNETSAIGHSAHDSFHLFDTCVKLSLATYKTNFVSEICCICEVMFWFQYSILNTSIP